MCDVREKSLVPTRGHDIDSSSPRQCTTKRLASLIDQEYKLINIGEDPALLSECRKMQDDMALAVLMLTVFEKSDKIFDNILLCSMVLER